jgi:predicted nucleic acid-binding protein
MTAERFVVDTNVLISAALRETSTPRAILRRIEDCGGTLLFSDETFEELRTRLQ